MAKLADISENDDIAINNKLELNELKFMPSIIFRKGSCKNNQIKPNSDLPQETSSIQDAY
jgi:hypothetical protein